MIEKLTKGSVVVRVLRGRMYERTVVQDYRPEFDAVKIACGDGEPFTVHPGELITQAEAEMIRRERRMNKQKQQPTT